MHELMDGAHAPLGLSRLPGGHARRFCDAIGDSSRNGHSVTLGRECEYDHGHREWDLSLNGGG